MKYLIKISIMFIVMVFFLSINIKGKTIFNHLYTLISPVTQSVQDNTERVFTSSFEKTKNYSKRLFDNSVPRVKDSVGAKMSGVKKVRTNPEETITREEKEELDELIKSHR